MKSNESNDVRKKSYFKFALYAYLIGVLFFVLLKPIPIFKRHSYNRDKICFSNIRVIQGAVEMYNMDAKKGEEMGNLDIDTLLKANYLKEIPKKPEESCQYFGSNLYGDGSVFCSYHGDVEGKTTGSRKERFSNKFNFNENLDQLPYALAWPIIVPLNLYFMLTSR